MLAKAQRRNDFLLCDFASLREIYRVCYIKGTENTELHKDFFTAKIFSFPPKK